jgi:hypothetical protein
MTHWIEADDFSISSQQQVVGFTFWASIESGGTYMGNITWRIYSDSIGNPGALIDSGSTIAVQTFFDDTDSGPSYEFDSSIPQTTLDAGAYWLGLHNGTLDSNLRSAVFWETTDPNSSATVGRIPPDNTLFRSSLHRNPTRSSWYYLPCCGSQVAERVTSGMVTDLSKLQRLQRARQHGHGCDRKRRKSPSLVHLSTLRT